MKKGVSLIFLLLIFGIFLFSLNFITSASCSGTGYNWNVHGHFKTDCTGAISLSGDSRCVTFSSHSSCVNMGSWGQGWDYRGSEGFSWTCADLGYTSNYQCSGSEASREYLTGHCGSLGSDNNDCYGQCGSQTSSYVRYSSWDSNCCNGNDFWNVSLSPYSICNSSGLQSATQNCVEGGTCTTGCTIGTYNTTVRSCSLITSANWLNTNGLALDSVGVSDGDTVIMNVGGFNILGKNLNYSIYKLEGPSFTNLWGLIKTYTAFTSDQPMYTLTTSPQYYFNVSVNNLNGLTSFVSSSINVSSDSSGSKNTHPTAVMVSPVNNFKGSISTLINFTQASYDSDDLLNVTWDFGDGNITSCSAYSTYMTPTKCNFQHSYLNGGEYTVKLTVQEATRGQSNSTSIKISVFKPGINVRPVISQPADGVSLGGVRIVRFNASGSYVANCTNKSLTQQFFPAGNLNCTYIQAPGLKTYSGSYNIAINWTITTAGSSEVINKYGDWAATYNQTVEFTQLFSRGGIHTAHLDMIYNS